MDLRSRLSHPGGYVHQPSHAPCFSDRVARKDEHETRRVEADRACLSEGDAYAVETGTSISIDSSMVVITYLLVGCWGREDFPDASGCKRVTPCSDPAMKRFGARRAAGCFCPSNAGSARRAFRRQRDVHIEFEGVFGRACMVSFPSPPGEDWVGGLGLRALRRASTLLHDASACVQACVAQTVAVHFPP
jgi:hypothetical protein